MNVFEFMDEGKRKGQDAFGFCNDEDCWEMMRCPKYKVYSRQDEMFGFVYCTVCGYCTHPSDCPDNVCVICGKEVE